MKTVLAQIHDEVDKIAPNVIRSMMLLKKRHDLGSTSLDVKEILNAMAISAVSDKNADKCLNALHRLRGV